MEQAKVSVLTQKELIKRQNEYIGELEDRVNLKN